MKWITLVIVITLCGCGYSYQMNKKVYRWIGHSKIELTQEWGEPTWVRPQPSNRTEYEYRIYKPPYNYDVYVQFWADSTDKIDSASWQRFKEGTL